ncbi:LysR family transcriptional regulator [Methylosinus sporium]|uniref:LysR family transcriptional regulator n=1 Tax=Methylosinus sporium TaxID=428 RepID=A0A549SCP2_METSR|nr:MULTISPECIES: LysR family transcriptional regulator [Methylosinus]MBU3887655.1 LysR family transcriptional regulator [Methylosinus sp. KRF6]TRL22648.1 LysR family transcriptional regulator [Methylosinus sporium]
MDRFDAMRAFTRIVERRSFTKAAEDLGLPRSSVTDAVKVLEARLGVRLLQRTTRQVSPTLDGEAYYRRCVGLIADLEDAEAGFTGAKPSGLVRIDVHGTQARHFLLPGLPRFLEAYPDIRLHIGEAHQALDMIREGFDCMLRAGELTVDSVLIRRRLATLERGTFASPGYVSRFGIPKTIDSLEADGHRMVGFYAPDAPEVAPFDFLVDGLYRRLALPSLITVTGAETNVASACVGLGLIQVPRYRVAGELAAGKLIEVLQHFPPSALPVHVLYSHTRQLSPRLRVVIDWMAEQFRSMATSRQETIDMGEL